VAALVFEQVLELLTGKLNTNIHFKFNIETNTEKLHKRYKIKFNNYIKVICDLQVLSLCDLSGIRYIVWLKKFQTLITLAAHKLLN